MPDKPLGIGFNVPFREAIAQATKRDIVLPDRYYDELQGIARRQAFSIAGITSLDTLQAVKDSLDKVIAEGGTFGAWKKQMLKSGTLTLPRHRLDNIYRTNLQGSYMAARWDRFLLTQATRPYILYDAINDSRVRPAHLALDGIIRRIDDPFWLTHSAPNGYRCRCSMRSLSEDQARARSGEGKGLNQQPVYQDINGVEHPADPDKGWDYNPSDRMAGLDRALADRREKSSPVLMQALDAKMASTTTITNEFIPAKTVKEAERYLVDNNIVDFADFGKIKDIDIVNQWNRALFETIQEFPELRANQKFTGSCQAQYSLWHKIQTNKYIDTLVKQGYTEEQAKYWAKIKVKKPKTSGQYAHSVSGGAAQGIAFNEKFALNKQSTQKMMSHDIDVNFHPPACNTIKFIADHELGHQIDDLLELSRDVEIINLFNATTEIEVSRYARENINEFIAESWGEYRNNPTARETSKRVGKIIAARYRAKFGH